MFLSQIVIGIPYCHIAFSGLGLVDSFTILSNNTRVIYYFYVNFDISLYVYDQIHKLIAIK